MISPSADALAVSGPVEMLVWFAGLTLALIVIGVLIGWLRRRAIRMVSEPRQAAPGFDIEDLEAMRASGELSHEEFRRLRATLLGVPPAGEPPLREDGGSADEDTGKDPETPEDEVDHG